MDQLRRQKRERTWNNQEITDARSLSWQFAHDKDGWTDLMEALSLLSREMRIPIILKHYYGYSYEEIGRMMDVPIGTVKSRIHNGLQQMRKEMRMDEEEAK
jgi:RNA polymerase sigma-70 factor (ECF subfamily)